MSDRGKSPKEGSYGPGYGSKVLGKTVTETILSRNGGFWKGYLPSTGTKLAGGSYGAAFCVYCFDSGPSCVRCGRVRSKVSVYYRIHPRPVRSSGARQFPSGYDLKILLPDHEVQTSGLHIHPGHTSDLVTIFDLCLYGEPVPFKGYRDRLEGVLRRTEVCSANKVNQTFSCFAFLGRLHCVSSYYWGSSPAPDESLMVSNGTRCRVRDEVRVSEPQVKLPYPRRYQYPTTDCIRQLLTTASGSYRNRKVKTFTLTGNDPQLHGN